MIAPSYQERKNEELTSLKKDKIEVKIIAGEWEGKKGPVEGKTPVFYFDVTIH
jgi:redox-sensitive bicupin YhaK (pirin superfamily)